MKNRIEKDNINLEIFKNNYRLVCLKRKSKTRTPSIEIFVVDSNYNDRAAMKKRMVEEFGISDECSECHIKKEWNKKPLVLQLDHKNGIKNDNRIENLRLLCPNCHSQTDNFSGKNTRKPKKIYFCVECNTEFKGYGLSCKECSSKKQRRFQVSKEELEDLIQKFPMTEIGKKFGVSDNAVKKRCRLLNVDMTKRKFR